MVEEPDNDETQEEKGAPSGLYLTARQKLHLWYVGGVVIGGLTVITWAAHILFEIPISDAWIGEAISAAAFIACFDSYGNFKWIRALIAIGLAVVVGSAFQRATGEPVFVLGGVLGFIVYHILGSLSKIIGKSVLSRWSRKLQAQIAKASPGETIVIQPGEYPSQLLIDKSVTLRAEGEVVLQGLSDKFIIGIKGEDSIKVTLEGFWIEDGGVGILVGGRVHVTLVNNTVTGNGVGVIIKDSAYVSMDSNDCSGNEGDGIILAGESKTTLTKNQITENGGRGIALLTMSCFSGMAITRASRATRRLNAAQANSSFHGLITGDSNVIQDNGKGNFCPVYPGKPWPEEFLEQEGAKS